MLVFVSDVSIDIYVSKLLVFISPDGTLEGLSACWGLFQGELILFERSLSIASRRPCHVSNILMNMDEKCNV